MRIAILTNTFPPDGRGGAERTAWAQAEGLMKRGNEVHVWAVGGSVGSRGTGATSPAGQEVSVTRFASRYADFNRMGFASRFFFHLLTDAFVRKDLVKEIIAWKPDILLTHNLVGCGIGTARAVQSRGVRWIHTLHDIQLTDVFGQETTASSKTVITRMHRACSSLHRHLFFGVPDVVVSPTKWLLDWHKDHGFFKTGTTAVIPNPIEINAQRERHLRIPATITYVGRLSRDKGFDIFLEAVKHLPESLVGRIVVVGGGALMSAAERVEDRRLDMRGALSFEDARRAIADADLLVAPSQILENQQTILLEAMAEGTPAVATDVGGTRETLAGTGCPVVRSGDGTALADAIANLLSHPDEWQRVSRMMRERVDRHEKEKYILTLSSMI